MRVAILESIVMPAGHEVEFDRILINELKRQGHEPVLFVPENFPFKVDYGVDIVYLNGRSRFYPFYENAVAAIGSHQQQKKLKNII